MQCDRRAPDLHTLAREMGDVGLRLAAMRAAAGAAGNLSLCVRGLVGVEDVFADAEELALDSAYPALAGATVLVTGSGCRLGEVAADPEATLGAVEIGADGASARLFTSPRRRFERLTVELSSHLSVHNEHLGPNPGAVHAIVHAQPPHLTYLTHIPECRGAQAFSRCVLRWHPELVFHLRAGIGYVPFTVPGTRDLAGATLVEMRTHLLVAWEKHGVISRGSSIGQACDWIDYAESGAHLACLNLANAERGEGLTLAEARAVCEVTGVECAVW